MSEANSGTSYESLSDALTVINNILEPEQKKGGMTIKYIQTSDNKYVQYRLMANAWSTIVSDWQGVDEEPVAGSHNLVESGGAENRISNSVGGYVSVVLNSDTIEQGGIRSSDGEEVAASSRVRTTGYIVAPAVKVEITSGKYTVFGYNDDGYVGSSGSEWITENGTYYITGATKYRIAFARDNDTAINPNTFSDLGASAYKVKKGEVVKFVSQVLTDEEKAQARANIGAGDVADVNSNTFKVDEITDKVGVRVLGKYWASSNSAFNDGGCYMIPVKNASVISFVGNGSSNSNYAFLTGYDVENNTLSLVTGTSIYTISSNANTSKDVPEGTLFIYLLAAVGAVNRLPSVFKVDGVDVIPSLVQSIATVKAGIDTLITTLTNRVSGYEGDITTLQNISLYSKIRGAYLVSPTLSQWTKNSIHIRRLNIYYNVSSPKMIELNTTYIFTESGFLLLNFSDLDNITVSQVTSMTNKPYDAILLRYVDGIGFVDGLLFGQYVTMFRSPINYIREVPKNNAALNVYKKAKQFELVKWTPKLDVPDNTHAVGFDAGTEYQGLPYSSVKEKMKLVGFDVSLLTFMTAVNNKYSLFYTEDTNGNRSRSGYGFTYYGLGCGCYFGVVCNIFALHALGFKVPYNTMEFHYLADKGILEAAYDQSANGLELMDLLWQRGHCSLIDDIYKDMRGNIKQVYWNDSISPAPRSFALTADQFTRKMVEDGVIIYHYKELYKNINYEPSPFVAVEDEVIAEPFVYNNDICTYAGDYACFKVGEKIVLNYNLTDDSNFAYTGVNLYKLSGTSYVQVGSTISVDSSHKLDITSNLTGYGKYKACMTDGANESEPTFFEVVSHSVTYEDVDGNNKKVSYSSDNGRPLYLEFVYGGKAAPYNPVHVPSECVAGQCCGTYEFTDEEKANGYCIINPVALRDSQYQATNPDDTIGYRPFDSGEKGDIYVRVHIEGDYGRIISDYILTDLFGNT